MKTKRFAAALLCCILLVCSAGNAFAIDEGEERVTMGANLDEEQRAQVYADFGLKQDGSVKELRVTNAEERAYLEGLVPDRKIGSVALSCIYIKTLGAGEGLHVTTNNINWCTEEMYVNALTTAGISDATVKVSAPFPVSGTAALTGVYKAYEDITGAKLNEDAKNAGTIELVITGEIADYIGSKDATELVNELKGILDQTVHMSDAAVCAEIRSIADSMEIALTEVQIDKLLGLCRSLEKLDVDELQEKIRSIGETIESVAKTKDVFTKISEGVRNFFTSVGSFFTRLFGGN